MLVGPDWAMLRRTLSHRGSMSLALPGPKRTPMRDGGVAYFGFTTLSGRNPHVGDHLGGLAVLQSAPACCHQMF